MITLTDHLRYNSERLTGQQLFGNVKQGDPSKYIRKRKKKKELESEKNVKNDDHLITFAGNAEPASIPEVIRQGDP